MAMNFYNARVTTSSENYYKDSLQALIDKEFYDASDVYTIQEETSIGSGVYEDVDVRIMHIIQSDTGQKMSDDFKAIVFKDIEHARGLGFKYVFDSNTWLTNSTDLYKYVTASTIVRRCNNELKWIDNGVVYSEPCIIDYNMNYDNADFQKTVSIPDGVIRVFCQGNDNTNNIKLNQRFLFGNQYQCFKVQSINNFLKHGDNAPVISFSLYIDNISSNDNLTLGIADYYNNYINDTALSGIIINPNVTSLKQGEEQIYTVYKYSSGIRQNDTFTITASGVLSPYYTLTVLTGNSFKVKNNQYNLDDKLIITCENNVDHLTDHIDIDLRWI